MSISGKVNQDNIKSDNASQLSDNDLSKYAGTYTEVSGIYKFYIDSKGKVTETISAPTEGVKQNIPIKKD